jgi:glycosyltransferase involved in cell wall biosynthesis
MKPLVSILIPAYNAETWIADTLRSAIAQTWPRKEIIVIDDGSTDQTLSVARKFESDGVLIMTQKNQGAASARNKAFAASRGDYIQWLDADDLLAPDKVARQMELLDSRASKKTLLSSAWGSFMYRPYRAKFVPTALWCDLSPAEWLLRKMEFNLHMQTATWLTSRELCEAAGPWNTSMLSDDDGEFFSRVILASDGIRFARSARVFYRSVGTNRLSYVGQSNKKVDALWGSMQLHIRYLRSLEDSQRARAACLTYLQTWLMAFYPDRPDILSHAEQLAKQLGGELRIPSFSWKYSWIKALFGWRLAKRAQLLLPAIRWSAARWCDRILLFCDAHPGKMNAEDRAHMYVQDL